MTDDEEVWKKISNADAAAFDAFYRESAPRHRAFLRRIVGNPQAAEDVAQDAFTQIWIRPNGFQPERGSLRGYLYGIARKRAAEWWRNQTPSDRAAGPEPSDCKTEAAPLPLQQQMFARTASCLLGLTRNDSPALSGRGIVEF